MKENAKYDMRDYRETAYLEGDDGVRYCAYCGKELRVDEDYGSTFCTCDCEDAQKELALKREIRKMEDRLRMKEDELQAFFNRTPNYVLKKVVKVMPGRR